MSPTGNNPTASNSGQSHHGGVTLIELICVMALLTIVMSLVAPSLAHFFRGRTLDAEARRLLGLARYGQSRAVSEGVPMVLWMDEERGAYGLKSERADSDQDDKAVEFELAKDLKLEVQLAVSGLHSMPWKITTTVANNRPAMRFTPDGFIGDNSPDRVVLRQVHEGEDDLIWIGLSRNRLYYEIQTNALQTAAR